MKTKTLLVLFIAFNLLSCSKDSNDDNPAASFTFQVEVQNVTDRAATITWTRPEGSNITYQVYLNNELIEDDFGLTAYTFNGLSDEKTYNGKITATDGNQTATVGFSFNTEIYVPNIYEGGPYFNSQQAINEFGSHHYNEIKHNLTIYSSDIHDLTPLYDLKKVHGKIDIKHTSLETFQGLENLEFIGGKLVIYRCDILDNLDALENLKTINDDIEIYSNGLNDINGLRNVENFSNGVGIGQNNITNVDIMNDATSLQHLSLVGNEKLETVTGFQNVSKTEDYLDIFMNYRLTSLQGLRNIITIGGIFILEDNTDLATIDLINLTTVGNYMNVVENQGMTNLDGFSSLSSVSGDIYISNHQALSDFCGVSSAVLNNTSGVYIGGNLYNPTLQDFQNGDCRL